MREELIAIAEPARERRAARSPEDEELAAIAERLQQLHPGFWGGDPGALLCPLRATRRSLLDESSRASPNLSRNGGPSHRVPSSSVRLPALAWDVACERLLAWEF